MKQIDSHGKPYNRFLVMSVMMLAAIAGSLMQTSLGTALPTLMKAFDINLSTAQQATTWFLLANGIMVPISAYLANNFSTKWLHVSAYIMLLVGVVLTVMTPQNADSWWIFVLGRVITGIGVGIILPLMQIVILNMYKEHERAGAMGMMGLVVGMAPAFGPTLTGLILEKNHIIFGMTLSNDWTSIFVAPLLFIILAVVLSPFTIKDIIPMKKTHLDILSLCLSTIGFGLFLFGFTNVSSQGWDDFISVICPIVSGIVMLVLFAFRQTKLEVPFLDIRVFLHKDFTVPTLLVLFATMAMYGVEMMLPTYLQNIRGLTPLDSGLALMWGALMMGLVSPVVGKIYNKVGIKRLSFVGFGLLTLGTIPFLYLTAETPQLIITILYALRMIGVATVLMPLTTSAMSALPKKQLSDGTAANNTIRQISSSIVVALLTSIVQNVINTNKPSSSLKHSDPLLYISKTLAASMNGFISAFTISLGFAIIGIVLIFCLNSKKETVK